MKEALLDAIMQLFTKHDLNQTASSAKSPLSELLSQLKDAIKAINGNGPLDTVLSPENEKETITEPETFSCKPQSAKAIRIYNAYEQKKLGFEGQRLLHLLESNKVIDAEMREKIVRMAMELSEKPVESIVLKRIILLVISQKKPERLYLEWIAHLFFHTPSSTKTLH